MECNVSCSLCLALSLYINTSLYKDYYYSEPSSPQPNDYNDNLNDNFSSNDNDNDYSLNFTLLDYLNEQLSNSNDDYQLSQLNKNNFKFEIISNFLKVPLFIENFLIFGLLICLDSFLYNLTLLPLRILKNFKNNKLDLIKMIVIVLTTLFLYLFTDSSKIYHLIRGQDNIKLYVIFNVLEIFDKLCSSIGQDILDSLSSSNILLNKNIYNTLLFSTLTLIYSILHSLIFLYQLVALNVAVNSYDNTLLTLLISNQFVEIKGSVFKKFDKESLFQITCADIVERFQLMLMLSVIAFRNLIELSGSDFYFLPRAFIKSNSKLETIFSPVIIVMLSEIFVDWLKHAFITKFNHIRPTVYDRFMDVLALDFIPDLNSFKKKDSNGSPPTTPPLIDQSPRVSRRLGFAAIPLNAFFIRVVIQALGMLSDSSSIDECEPLKTSQLYRGSIVLQSTMWILLLIISWLVLLALKLLLGINILAFAQQRQFGSVERKTEDLLLNVQNIIGESPEEKVIKYFFFIKRCINIFLNLGCSI